MKIQRTISIAILMMFLLIINSMYAVAAAATTLSGLSPDFIPEPNTAASTSTSTIPNKATSVASTTATAATSQAKTSQVVPILSYGSSGYNVTLLQTKLKKIGYFSAIATGKFLTTTKSSVVKFQKNAKLTTTGVVGILTWNALNKRINAASPSRGQVVSPTVSKLSIFNRVLKNGCKGSDVVILQDKLIAVGLLTGKKDGIYGKLTAGSVKSFQTYQGIAASGTADELTISHLLNTVSLPGDYLEKLKQQNNPGSGSANPSDGQGSPSTTTPSAIDPSTGQPTATPVPTSPSVTPTPTLTPLPTPTPTSSPAVPDSNSGVPSPNPTTTGSAVTLPVPGSDSSIPDSNLPPEEIDSITNSASFVGKTIIIDPGHGFSDPGAARSSVYEKAITLAVGLKLKQLLATTGANVIMTRETDGSNGLHYLYYRSAVANKAILTLEINKTNETISAFIAQLASAESVLQSKALTLQQSAGTAATTSTAIDSQKDLLTRAKLQQEYNAALQTVADLQASISDKQIYLLELEQQSSELDVYLNNPGLKDRTSLYALSGGVAGNDLKAIFDLTNESYSNQAVFISIHVNSTNEDTTTASGTKVYISDKVNSYYSGYYSGYNQTLRDKLGSLLQEQLNLATNFSKKTLKPIKSNLSVLRENNLVSALIETGFINNASDRKLLQQSSTQDALATGIFNGLEAFFSQNP